MSHRLSLLIIGLFGLTGVALGAFGAHALNATLLSRGMTHAWDTAVHYQLIHTVALLALICLRTSLPALSDRLINWVVRSWMLGVLLFSGSLYLLALGGPRFLGPITPLGGVGFIFGWGCLIAAALKLKEPAAK